MSTLQRHYSIRRSRWSRERRSSLISSHRSARTRWLQVGTKDMQVALARISSRDLSTQPQSSDPRFKSTSTARSKNSKQLQALMSATIAPSLQSRTTSSISRVEQCLTQQITEDHISTQVQIRLTTCTSKGTLESALKRCQTSPPPTNSS